MNIHAIAHGSRVNGPGLRSVVWVQGCVGMDCPGCWNPATHPSNVGRESLPWTLAEEIASGAELGTEGITISGGEPLQQVHHLLSLVLNIRRIRPRWSIGIYSGYTREEALARDMFWPLIEDKLDWGIMGRYDRTQPPSQIDPARPDRHCVSSANQRLELFSSRYGYSDFPPLSVECSIDNTGLTTITGFPVRGA